MGSAKLPEDNILSMPAKGDAPAEHPSAWRTAIAAFDLRPLVRSKYGIGPLVALFLLTIFQNLPHLMDRYVGLLVKHDLGLNYFKLLALSSTFFLLGLLLAAPIGFLSDRVRRTVLVGGGGILTAVSLLLQGFGYTGVVYGAGSATGGMATTLGAVPQLGLLADYVPVSERVRASSLVETGKQVAGLLLPIPLAIVVASYGWRVILWFAWIPVLLISLYIMLRLPEPKRGYQERIALGASEEAAEREQPTPSWAESWRLIWSVRTLRFISIAAAISSLNGLFAVFGSYYFIEHWHQTAPQVAAVRVAEEIATLIALFVGAGFLQSIANSRPSRVFQLQALIGVVVAVSTGLVVIFPVLGVSIAASIVRAALTGLVSVGGTALLLNVMPARARGVAASITVLLVIPVLVLQPLGGLVADAFGLQATLLIGASFPLIGAMVTFYAARFYEYDVRNQKLAAIATEEHARSKELGETKQLVCRRLDVHYGAVQVLFGVDFDVVEGELIALLGTNGAGKSTLLRAISGLSEATSGAVIFDGDDITHIPPNEIAGRGIIYMQGGKSGFPSLTVRESLKLGSWLHGKDAQHPRDMEQVFGYFPVLRERLDQVAGTLSGGEQQMLALSLAFLSRPRILLIDELSLGLAPQVVEQLLGIVRAIHADGTTIVIVEQSVNIALKVAKRAIFMEKGEVRFTGPTEELLSRPDILRSVFLKGAAAGARSGVLGAPTAFATSGLSIGGKRAQQLDQAPAVLQVSNLAKSFGGRPVLNGVTFDLRDGEILGVIGANGAGKTTMFDVLSGFQSADDGVIVFNGEDITAWTPDARARAGLIRRFQDARLFPTLTVAEVIAISFERQHEARSLLLQSLPSPSANRAEKRLQARVDQLVELMQLESFRDKFVSDLSTGTRRVVDLACVIATGPRVLLLDEPSAGIAQKESEEMGPLLQRVRYQTGCSMIVIEHDMALISQLADDLMVLNLGRVMTRGEPRGVLEDERVVNVYLGTAGALEPV